jgi:hypothetical protein
MRMDATKRVGAPNVRHELLLEAGAEWALKAVSSMPDVRRGIHINTSDRSMYSAWYGRELRVWKRVKGMEES